MAAPWPSPSTSRYSRLALVAWLAWRVLTLPMRFSRLRCHAKFLALMLTGLGVALGSLRAASPSTANPRAVATFECAGLYWRPAAVVTVECQVRYRMAGAARWQEALPLVLDARDGEFRGSIVGLAPDTAYEAELTAGAAGTRLSFRTRSDRFPLGRTTHLPAGESTRPIVITESGTPEAYHLVTAAPGARSTIDLRNTADIGIRVNADYVIVRGIEIRNAGRHALAIGGGHHDVVVEQCHMIYWGRGGGSSSFGSTGGNTDSAIAADAGTRHLTVQRNLLEYPRGAANDWESGHPAGPQAISIFNSEGGNVVRYNVSGRPKTMASTTGSAAARTFRIGAI